MSGNWLDVKIKNTFGIGVGLRSKEEDEQIFNKVLNLVVEEIINFAQGKLTKVQQNMIAKLIDQNESPEIVIRELMIYFKGVPNVGFRIRKRVEYFVDSLLVNIVSVKHE